MEAYAAGVNAFLEHGMAQLPPELRLLKVSPAPWTPVDSVVVTMVMAFRLSYGWQHVIPRDALDEMCEDGWGARCRMTLLALSRSQARRRRPALVRRQLGGHPHRGGVR